MNCSNSPAAPDTASRSASRSTEYNAAGFAGSSSDFSQIQTMRRVTIYDDRGTPRNLCRVNEVNAANPKVERALYQAYENAPSAKAAIVGSAFLGAASATGLYFVLAPNASPLFVPILLAIGVSVSIGSFLVAYVQDPIGSDPRSTKREWAVRTCVTEGVCPACGYALGKPSMSRCVCPECGSEWDVSLSIPALPRDSNIEDPFG